MITTAYGGQVQVAGEDVYQGWTALLKALLERGQGTSPRGQKTKELVGLQLRILHARRNVIADPQRKLNYRFLVGQWLATMAGVEDKFLEPYNKVISQFEEDGIGGKYPSYGPRLLPQWPYVLKQLMDDVDSRQAVASIWEAQRLENERYVPCTLSLQFLLRPRYLATFEQLKEPDDRPLLLHTIATMRSSDAWLGLPYDIFNFTMMANLIAGALSSVRRHSVDLGELVMNLGSSHLYEKHWETARSISTVPAGKTIVSPRLPASINSGPLTGLQQLLTRTPQPLEEKDWAWWPWPWKNYVQVLEAKSNADALVGLENLERRNGQ